MSDLEQVVVTLAGIGVAGHVAVVVRVEESFDSASEHLVDVCLMADIENDAVGRGIEHIVQRDGCLDHSEVWPDVTAVSSEFADKRSTKAGAQQFQPVHVVIPDVGGRFDAFQIYFHDFFKISLIVRCKDCVIEMSHNKMTQNAGAYAFGYLLCKDSKNDGAAGFFILNYSLAVFLYILSRISGLRSTDFYHSVGAAMVFITLHGFPTATE